MNYNVVIALMESAYNKFKLQFPNEEPFFRITCSRKFGRSDRHRSWRPKNLETRTVFPDRSSKFSQDNINASLDILGATEAKGKPLTKKQQRDLEDGKTNLIREDKVIHKHIRPRPIKLRDADTRRVEVTKVPYDACVDLRFDDPISVSVFKYCVDSANTLLKEIRTEYKLLLEDPLFNSVGSFVSTIEVDSVHTIEDSLEKIKKIQEKEIEMRDRVVQMETVLPKLMAEKEVLDDLSKSVKAAFKESTTVQDVVSKYIDMQRKLNDLKSYVVPLMRKYNEEPFIEKVAKNGFISTVKEFIEYLHQNTMKSLL